MVTRKAEVPLVNGYYLPNWFSIVLPEATENLVLNPSVEINTTGYTAVGAGAVIARTIAEQRRGAYALQVTPAAGVASGVYYGTITTVAGTAYTLAIDIKGVAGHVYNLYFATAAGVQLGSSKEFVGTGYWQRVHVSYPETAALARRFYIVQDASDAQPFYVDGWQVEAKSYPTTYCDGDLEGFVIGEVAYYWTGTFHGSSSIRAATTRSGGKIVNLSDFGFNLLGAVGLGLAPVQNFSLPSNLGGAFYQNTVEGVRQFSIVGDINQPKHYQVSGLKMGLEKALSYNLTPYRQPLLLHFQETDDCGVAVGDELYIKCIYETGIEGNTSNLNAENFPLQFSAFDNYSIYEDGDAAMGMDYVYDLVTGGIVRQSPDGTWDNLNGGAPPSGQGIRDIVVTINGDIYVCGEFTSVGGVAANRIASYINGTWAALGVGIDNIGERIIEGQDGRIYVGGQFANAGGAAASRVAIWNPTTAAWSALGAGVNGTVRDMTFVGNGDLIVVGDFATAGGNPAVRIARWTPSTSTWAAIGAGLDNTGRCIKRLLAGNVVYVGGSFANAGGVAAARICRLDTSTNTYTALGVGTSGLVSTIEIDKNLYVHARGNFLTAGGIAAIGYAVWNGSQWSVPYLPPDQGQADNPCQLSLNPVNGDLYITSLPGPVMKLQGQTAHVVGHYGIESNPLQREFWNRVKVTSDGTLFIFSRYGDDVLAANLSASNIFAEDKAVYNNRLVIRQLAFGSTLKLVGSKVLNQDISMDYGLQSGETVTVQLNPLQVTSSFLGNITQEVFPGSYLNTPDYSNIDISILLVEDSVIYNDGLLGHYFIHPMHLYEGVSFLNTNGGILYVTVVSDGLGAYHIDFFSDAARLVLVGHTVSQVVTGYYRMVQIVPDGANGISGYVGIEGSGAGNATIYAELGLVEVYLQYNRFYNSLAQARYA